MAAGTCITAITLLATATATTGTTSSGGGGSLISQHPVHLACQLLELASDARRLRQILQRVCAGAAITAVAITTNAAQYPVLTHLQHVLQLLLQTRYRPTHADLQRRQTSDILPKVVSMTTATVTNATPLTLTVLQGVPEVPFGMTELAPRDGEGRAPCTVRVRSHLVNSVLCRDSTCANKRVPSTE